MEKPKNIDGAPSRAKGPYPTTPDGRYFVVQGQLWRSSNPALTAECRERLVRDLMHARRDIGAARRSGDDVAEADGRLRVDVAKRGLGERGPVWWHDGAPDLNRHRVSSTVYADWHAALASDETAT